ncbi:uncharacterized protein NPIL_363101, partial [Nephila pilipes]
TYTDEEFFTKRGKKNKKKLARRERLKVETTQEAPSKGETAQEVPLKVETTQEVFSKGETTQEVFSKGETTQEASSKVEVETTQKEPLEMAVTTSLKRKMDTTENQIIIPQKIRITMVSETYPVGTCPILAQAIHSMASESGLLNLIDPDWETKLKEYSIHQRHMEKRVPFSKGKACRNDKAYVKNIAIPALSYKVIVLASMTCSRVKPDEPGEPLGDLHFVTRECPPLTRIGEAM